MKPEDRKELLEDLYPNGGGPPVEGVLARLRRDRAARGRRKLATVAGTALFIVGATVTALWESPPEVVTPQVQVAAVQTPETVERISDEELLAAMGRPAALVTLPDGRQSVLYLDPVARRQ